MTTQSINTEENSLNEENDILNICLADFGDNGIDEIAYYLQNINLEKIYDLISVYSVLLSKNNFNTPELLGPFPPLTNDDEFNNRYKCLYYLFLVNDPTIRDPRAKNELYTKSLLLIIYDLKYNSFVKSAMHDIQLVLDKFIDEKKVKTLNVRESIKQADIYELNKNLSKIVKRKLKSHYDNKLAEKNQYKIIIENMQDILSISQLKSKCSLLFIVLDRNIKNFLLNVLLNLERSNLISYTNNTVEQIFDYPKLKIIISENTADINRSFTGIVLINNIINDTQYQMFEIFSKKVFDNTSNDQVLSFVIYESSLYKNNKYSFLDKFSGSGRKLSIPIINSQTTQTLGDAFIDLRNKINEMLLN